MNNSIFYRAEGYSISQKKLMGRNSAGASFLKGYLRHSVQAIPLITVESHDDVVDFRQPFEASGRDGDFRYISIEEYQEHKKVDTIYFPGPGISTLAYQRSFFGAEAWSLCGITHTTSSATAMDQICDHITAPVQPWDALICTSQAVKTHVENLYSYYQDHLASRLGITKFVHPQLPVIPLGVNSDEFEFGESEIASSRDGLGITEDDVVFVYMGRLSFHAKAHPLIMYEALEESAKLTGKKLHLIECGWFPNEYIEDSFKTAARQVAPNLVVHYLDGREGGNRRIAWSASDIFISLAENIQETFGITPIEGMATGLPVIVSDWDGYRDSVRDGEVGFLIPTNMPPKGLGEDLAYRHALGIDTYDRYIGYVSSTISIDFKALVSACVALIESPELRLKMGQKGRDLVRDSYDWSVLIPVYESLWEELKSIRGSQSVPLRSRWPAREDPYLAFSHYPSNKFSTEDSLSLVRLDADASWDRYVELLKLEMVSFSKLMHPKESEIKQLISLLSSGQMSIEEVIGKFDPARVPFVVRGIHSLLKLNIIKLNLAT